MTAQELIADLRAQAHDLSPQDAWVIFNYLADYFIAARLANGQRICDVTDAKAFLRELAEAAKVSGVSQSCDSTEVPAPAEFRTWSKVTSSPTQPPEQPRWNGRCEECFHVHTGRYECTEYLGEGRFCKCSAKVPA